MSQNSKVSTCKHWNFTYQSAFQLRPLFLSTSSALTVSYNTILARLALIFIIVIVIKFIQQFFLVVKQPFVGSANLENHSLSKVFFCLYWPALADENGQDRFFFRALITTRKSTSTQHVIDVMSLLALIMIHFDRTYQLSIK